jgi:hypothetical protein
MILTAVAESVVDSGSGDMKPWHVSVIVLVLLLIGFVGWLVASYRRGRDGR